MKKQIGIILGITFYVCNTHATTVNIDWVSNGNTYDQTTCQTGGNFTLPAQNPTKYGHHFVGWHFDEITGTGSQNGTPTPTNPIYPTFIPLGNTVLRAVGDVADTYDPTTGLITRRVGAKVFDGTADVILHNPAAGFAYIINDMLPQTNGVGKCSHDTTTTTQSSQGIRYGAGANKYIYFCQWQNALGISTTDAFKQWLADQYNAGTPVTVYYPLATPTTETLE